MRLKAVLVCFLVVALLAVILPLAQSGVFDPFHTKEEKTLMWKELWSNHANTEYFSIGKYYDGTEMLMFVAGNQSGGRVLWDGEMHGNEDKGGELLFLLAQWLLESNDPQAIKILEENYVMFIPMVNNQVARGNGDKSVSEFGVDLNRNFETGWQKSNPADDTYSGPNPLSEPETIVMRNVFLAYQPTFYVNLHCGAGPYAAFFNAGNSTLSLSVKNRSEQISQEMGITPYRTNSFGSAGYAIGDAVQLGVQSSWLIETVGEATAWRHLPEHYDELVNTYFPKCLAIFVAMCELSSPVDQPARVVFVSQNPAKDAVHPEDKVFVQATITPSTAGIKSVSVHYSSNGINQNVANMTDAGNNLWTGYLPSFSQSTTITYSIVVEDNDGKVVSSESTVGALAYIVLSDPQSPMVSPTYSPKPSPVPTSRPPQSASPTSPPTNMPSTSPSQNPTNTPIEKNDNSLQPMQILPIAAIVSIGSITVAAFLYQKKIRKH
jgi:hypothetical protein